MSISSTAVLTVTPEGEFIWNENADQMIATGDFTGSPAMPHILRRLRQRDELLAVCQELEQSASYWSEYDVPLGIVDRIKSAIAKATGGAA